MKRFFLKLRIEIEAFWRKISGEKARRRREADAAFTKVVSSLKPGDLAIDLGANFGDFTAQMALSGASVIAFEPDPFAYDNLRSRMAQFDNVEILNAAAADQDGTLKLFRHKDFDSAPAKRTTASTLISSKSNIESGGGIEVEVVDFTAYVRGLSRDIKLLKVDIEGSEVALFEKLLKSDVASCIEHVFVETHERVLPELAERTRRLKKMTSGLEKPCINWDWR